MLRRRAIGVLAESYSKWERRAPLTPSHVKTIVERLKVNVLVQPSTKRIFTDAEYSAAGASITHDLSSAGIVLGVKQPALGSLLDDKTYCFFSHVIKAQPENMPLLDEALSKRVSLVDYECVREGGGNSSPRLIAFGEFAGKAGMVSGLRGLGLRLLALGYSTPLLAIGPPHSYADYPDARRALKAVGERIATQGLPQEFAPLVVCVAGTGNVSRGAIDALEATGVVEWVTPADLPALTALLGTHGAHQHKVYAVSTSTSDAVIRADDPSRPFDRGHYYAHPEEYTPVFHEAIAPHISLLTTTMYWDRRFPRLLSNEQLHALPPRLLGVADITCDVDGAVEALVRSSTVDEPFYLVDSATGREGNTGLDGKGVFMMGVDILPSELPREASAFFGDALLPFLEPLTTPGAPLPAEIAAATITEGGRLTLPFEYIASMRDARSRSHETIEAPPRSPAEAVALEGSTVLSLHGHLFDSGLINAALDVIETSGGRFDVLEVHVRPNASGDAARQRSSAILQLTLDSGRSGLDTVLQRLHDLAQRMPMAEAAIVELPDYCDVFDRTLLPEEGGKAPAAEQAASAASPSRRIVVLGAGMCAAPAVEMLSRSGRDTVTVVSAVPGQAAALCETLGRPPNVTALTLDVSESKTMGPLLGDADAALSLLPATMHAPIAAECIERGTQLVTASYISPELEALHEAAAARGVAILGEMGLDPGMDHMSSVDLIERVRGRGGAIVGFRSLCGGLPAPESVGPLGYKFSWSPAGVLAACKNSARYRDGGATVDVSDALGAARPLGDGKLEVGLPLEVLPNRDSLPYAKLYGIDDEATSVFRGTLRYAGWSGLFGQFAASGLTAAAPLPEGVESWPKLLEALQVEDGGDVGKAMRSLGVHDGHGLEVGTHATVADAFCSLLASRLSYGPTERDAVLMENTVDVEYPGGKSERWVTWLVTYGEGGERSAMSKTVGLTAALGVQRLLDKEEPPLAGVQRPTSPSVYQYVLPRLAKEGVGFEETVEVVD